MIPMQIFSNSTIEYATMTNDMTTFCLVLDNMFGSVPLCLMLAYASPSPLSNPSHACIPFLPLPLLLHAYCLLKMPTLVPQSELA